MLSDVKSKLDDETLIYVCICIPSTFEKNKDTLINAAKNIGLKKFVIVEEYKAESMEIILRSGENLNKNNIIWVCTNKYCCGVLQDNICEV